MDDLNVAQIENKQNVDNIGIKSTEQRTVHDWVRDMRMSADVNNTTVGVNTDKVTPDLLLATSRKLLGISRREQEQDAKDSMQFQRVYGPVEYFSEHVLRDSGKLGRNLLWKATNRGNLDFMQTGALDKHMSDVFYDSKLANMVDGSSPLELMDGSMKITRIGEGGVGDADSAPIEMRLVQPSFYGFVDPVRCYAEGTELMTRHGWVKVENITEDDELACYIEGTLEYHNAESLNKYKYSGKMYGYAGSARTDIQYLVTPNHRMYTRSYHALSDGRPCAYNIKTAAEIHGTNRIIDTAMHKPLRTDENVKMFKFPEVAADAYGREHKHGDPPIGAHLKNVAEVDICDFAELMGWYLSNGCCTYSENAGYLVIIAQDPKVYPENWQRIINLLRKLPFGCPDITLEEALKTGSRHIRINRKQLYEYLNQFGKFSDKFIPEWIFEAPLEARLRFREAMLLGDGEANKHYCSVSERLASDFQRLQFDLGYSTRIRHTQKKGYEGHEGMWVVCQHARHERMLVGRTNGHPNGCYITEDYDGYVYCPTVPGGLVYCRRNGSIGFWCGNSVDGFRIGLDAYLAKNLLKGSDGKLYRKMVNAHTGKEELVDSVTAAKSVVTTPDMMNSDTSSIYALGGKTGVRIVNKADVDYYMPRSDEMFSTSANLVPMLNGVKEMRLHMGCLHPMTALLTVDSSKLIKITRAKSIGKGDYIEGTKNGYSEDLLEIRNTVSKFPPKRNWFRKVVLLSGRTVVTSADHRWSVMRDGKWTLTDANRLIEGDIVPRSLHTKLPTRKTYMCGTFIDPDMAYMLGHAVRTLRFVDDSKLRIEFPKDAKARIESAVTRIGQSACCTIYSTAGLWCMAIAPGSFMDWLVDNVGTEKDTRQVPSAILSAGAQQAAAFLAGYTSDSSRVAFDGDQNVWILDIDNDIERDGLSVVLSRIGMDTLYRDAVSDGETRLAVELVEIEKDCGDFAVDVVKSVTMEQSASIMVDVDVDDNLFATASGIVTHNSKYALQSIPLDKPEPQLVRTMDEASGKDMSSLVGKYLGAQYARKPGHVTAVRKDRIDVAYDDGTKGQVPLYVNFPMNAKGFITNRPSVKAGQSFGKGDLLAASNWTDDKGVAAIGKPLRCAWISWKGGTYEDGITISESCAEKLRSTTMYPTAIDLDKTVKLGKDNYQMWKPGAFTKEQLGNLDKDGIVKPGTVLQPGDPMILAVQTTEPSPGTLGKRLLTDMSETWSHDHAGVVTDVVKTRKGVKVLATVSAPCEVGDKLSNSYGAKGTISQILPDDQMPQDKDGNAMDLLFSPLGLITRTNSSQLHETLLGKIAHKTGKPEIMPEFYDGDLFDYVSNRLKQHHLTPEDDLVNPETGKPLKGILNGYSYIYKLKHLAESKMAGRGTAAYTSEGLPSGGGYEGCFPARQEIMTLQGKKSIAEICERRQPVYVLTWDGGTWCYKQVTDWFTYRADVENILHIRTEFNLSDTGSGRMLRHHTSLYPTKNHKMYMADMSVKLAGELKPGDMLAGVVPVRIISIDQYTHDKPGVVNIPVYDFTVDETHRYVLSGGVLVSNSKRYGSLEQSAMVSHMAFNAIQDAKQIRGQSNSDFWRSIRTGGIPTMPGEPMVQRKFFAHLQGAGVNVRKTKQGVSVFALTNADVEELVGPRELKSKDTYEAKNFRPMDGGLFGQDIFGINGDKWGYIQLDEPVPNPVMEDPLARLLRMTQSDFEAVVAGEKTVDGMSSSADIAKRLQGIDLEAEAANAKREFKDSSKSRRDAALKRYKAIELMRRQGVRPEEYMLNKIPVLPPDYRPVSTHSGLTMVADSNYLYAQLLDARNDLRESKDLPDEYQQKARANLYRKWKELAGLYDPENPKLQSKNVKGLLAWALGNGSPKFSAFQRKVLGSTVDTVGRGVVVANPRVKLNEVGMPEKMAFDVYAPFVERELVKAGYTPIDAMKLTKTRDPKARNILVKVMQTHPVQMNRAPTLHKLSIMGFNPVLVPGHAIHVNPSIVSPFAMDFDGDTIHGEWLVQVDRDELSRNLEKLKIAEKSCLTNAKGMLYYDCDGQSARCETIIEKENNMLTKDAKARFSSAVCSPAELPVVEESKQVRGNVTEWDVVPGIYTDTIDLAGNRVIAPVTKVSRHENLKMFDVALSAMGLYPHIVTASEDHSLITFNANTFEYEKTRPEDAVGKLVPRMRKDATVSAEHCQRTIMLDKPYELSHDFGIILGMILGDGWVTEDGQCIVAACDESVQKELLRLTNIRDTVLPVLNETKVASYAADPARFSQADMQRIDLHVKYAFGKALREKIGHGAWNKRIPAECLRGSHAHLTGLLMGLLATDGTVSFADNTTAKKSKSKTVQVHTTSPELRDCIQELCSRIGIRTSVTAYMGEHSVHTCYAVSLSIVDLAKEYRRHPTMLHIPHDAKAAALERIVSDVESAESARRYPDIVPMPANMAAEFSWAKVCNAGCMSRFKEQGYLARPKALEMAKELKKLDWSAYVECKSLPMSQKTGHTPEQAKELVDRWIAMVEDERISWEHVDSVTPSTCTEGWDCTVPGPYTFTLSSGTVVQDTVNLHVPVSDQAIEDTYKRMFPERNLIAMRDRKVAYKPEKEYMQGTYMATRIKEGERTRIFDSLEDARKAYRDGQLDVDDPIIIRNQKN